MKMIDGNILLTEILVNIGFIPNTDSELLFYFGNCKLKAIQCFNPEFYEGISFFGFWKTEREMGEIQFNLPLKVESYEQGIAFISYYLRNARLAIRPDWLNEGLALQDLLPWRKELKEYEAIPKAIIEHEWFRLIVNKLRKLSESSSDEDEMIFSFVDCILKIESRDQKLVCPGIGKDWQQIARVKTKHMNFLPKRIAKNSVYIYIWKDKLHIGNRSFTIDS